MTREAKIGMLTGLGVIVLIGVLLSEYLGKDNSGTGGTMGTMAPLPVGEDYRKQVMSPVGVPSMTPLGGGERISLAGGAELASPIATGNGGGGLPPAMLAVDTGPRVTGPVSPVTAGATLMDGRSGGPPIITVADTVAIKTTDTTLKPTPAPVTTYTVASGDTLMKIAKKYYNSTKNSDIQRIVTANPTVLKDAATMLVVGKKLVIPNLPAPAPVAPVVAVAPKADTPGIVPLPGGSATVVPIPGVVQPPKKDGPVAEALPKPEPPKADSPKTTTYVVQSGDTLEKIARKFAPTKVNETVQKMISLNTIKNPKGLQVGQTLKLPA